MCDIVKIHENRYNCNPGKIKMKNSVEVIKYRCKTAFDDREKALTLRYEKLRVQTKLAKNYQQENL